MLIRSKGKNRAKTQNLRMELRLKIKTIRLYYYSPYSVKENYVDNFSVFLSATLLRKQTQGCL